MYDDNFWMVRTMIITRVVMHLFKRFSLPGIKHLDFTPNEIYQIILGTNGSGKSSFLRELTPFPTHSKRFYKGGYKIFECVHKGSKYALTSNFENGAKYTFVKDNQVLNNAGNAKVQTELVTRHFGIDNDIQSVLLGTTRFTQLNALARRDWLMRLSGNNYEYALHVHQLLKTKYRDTQGVIKHLNKRISDELDKLPSDEHLKDYEKQSATLKSELNVLLGWKNNTLPDKESIDAKLRSMSQRIQDIAKRLITSDVNVPTDELAYESADRLLGKREEQLNVLKGSLDELYKQHDEFSTKVAQLDELNVETRSDIQRTIVDCQEAINRLNLDIHSLIPNGHEKRQAFLFAKPMILDILADMPKIPADMTLTSDEISDALLKAKLELSNSEVEIKRLEHQIEHIEKSDVTYCPSCRYSWKSGDPDGKLQDIKQSLSKAIESAKDAKKSFDYYAELHEIKHDHYQCYRKLMQLLRSDNLLSLLHERIHEAWTGNISSMSVMSVVQKTDNDLHVSSIHSDYVKELNKANDALMLFDVDSDKNRASYQQKCHELEAKITVAISQIESLKLDVALLRQYSETINSFDQMKEELLTLAEESEREYSLYVQAVEQEMINDFMSERHSALGHVENILNKASRVDSVVREMEKQLKDVVLDSEAYQLMINELSPTDGLIADCLRGYIDVFADQMTSIIRSIWSYDYTILPCGVGDDNQLDYKFKFKVGMDDSDSDDVSEASESQVDIVDFAFRLLVIFHLQLESFPFYLDEPAVSLDETHRNNIILFIKDYVEMRKTSQLFLISHYFQQSGAFHPSETLMLDSTNIINVPSLYNKHVKITKS